jgi:hypothetical protein
MIELPDLDDRTFADLMDEVRALIPTLAPQWTDHNPTDPGIALAELLAWLTEIVLYRLNRIPDRSYRTFLRLLRGPAPAGEETAPLEDAIRAAIGEVRERYRAITGDDFEHLAVHRWKALPGVPEMGVPGVVRRARCFPEQSPATLTEVGGRAENHYTIAIVGDSLAASRGDLAAFDPVRRHALELDGLSGYVDCGNDGSLARTGALTLSAWIYPRALIGRQAIASKQGNEYELILESAGALTFRQAGASKTSLDEPHVQAGRWTHVAAVRAADGTTVRFYIDGKPAGEATFAQPAAASTAPVWLGRAAGGDLFFNGFLRDVCIWDAARGEVELGGDLRHPPPGSDDHQGADTPRPVACWRLDSSAGDTTAPDAETPAAAGPRDGTLKSAASPPDPQAARWRDIVRPIPASPALLAKLDDFFDEWRLITTKVDVIDHAPLAVTAAAKLYLRPDGVSEVVHGAALAALDRYFDPYRGWRGDGWPFGRAIFVSDVHALLDHLPGVDFVDDVAVQLANPAAPGRPQPPRDDRGEVAGVALHPHELPALGRVSLQLFTRVGAKWEPT